MFRAFGLMVAGAVVLGHAATANAQIGISVGSPFGGPGIGIGAPSYGYYGDGYSSLGAGGLGYSSYSSGFGSSVVGTTTYSSGYAGYAAPGTTYFNSGYYGGAFPAGYVAPYPLVLAPAYGYPAYGYPAYGRWGGWYGRPRGGWRW